MRASDISDALRLEPLTPTSLFSCLTIISKYVLEHGAASRVALDAIIRLRDLSEQRRISDTAMNDAIFSLCREAGLFPYLPESKLSWRDQVAYEFFRGPTEINYVFHREQWRAFQILLSGRSLVLSAPTSFGKSVLIHAFIAQKDPQCVVIVVPTIALLDQFRRRLTEFFGSNYIVITRNDQQVDGSNKRIYVLTQERLLERSDIESIDLLAIDEYYKLDSGRESEGDGSRTALLNVALRRYLGLAKQVFLLGPAVASVGMREDLREKFVEITSEFSTVAVDVHDHTATTDPVETIASLLREYRSDKSLIFSKSPPAARRLAENLIAKSPLPATEPIQTISDWLAENYHPEWPLVPALRAGYGMHHGAVPRSVAQILVRLFNEGELHALICTSTLIEGVNTAAKNVFIFDKKISNTNFDYFDFRNIAGRSGRIGHHFVGRIFLFHEPPLATTFQLEIPALGEDAALPDTVLVNLPDDTLNDELRIRKRALFENSSLPEELVRKFASYGIGNLEGLSQSIRNLLVSGDRTLCWRGNAGYAELLAVFVVAWRHLKFNKGKLTASEAAFHANRLRVSGSLRVYFNGLTFGKNQPERKEAIEKGFRALIAFDYAVPKVLIDLESLVNHHCLELEIEAVNYSYMAQSLDNLFSHHWVKALDEYGVPIPLGRKLSFLIEDSFSLEDAIASVKAYCRSAGGQTGLTMIERTLIEAALG